MLLPHQITKLFTSSIICLLINGCATAVSQEKKSTDGQYDGAWIGSIGETPSYFHTQNWRIGCYDPTGSIVLLVNKGVAELMWRGDKASGYVGNTGKFRIKIPIPGKIKNKVSNSGSLTRGRNFIFDGKLSTNDGVGRWTFAYEQLGDQGCNAKVQYKKG